MMKKALSLSVRQKEMYLKYSGLSLPRYTSYPSIPSWKDETNDREFKRILEQTLTKKKGLSLYFHIPFCQKLCFYCGCQKDILNPNSARSQDLVGKFLLGLEIECARFAENLGDSIIEQLHFGGGTPNFLSAAQWNYLNENILSHFNISKEAEWSVELDPRSVTEQQIALMRAMGVNRVSLGIQDFDPKVQKAINRVQSFEQAQKVVALCRSNGIAFINFDLIYGLPFQTEESMKETLQKVVQLNPDRIAYYRLAVLPQLFSAQKSFVKKDLPEGLDSLALNMLGINHFLEAGYEFIGLDHFAKASDPLAIAARENKLQRNFQGMTTGACLPLIGFGPSAISMLDDIYIQNPKSTDDWMKMIDGEAGARKSQILTNDDKLRREIINQIFCHGRVDKLAIEDSFVIDFDQYFAKELQNLERLKDDELVQLYPHEIHLTDPMGLLLRRVAASVFDAYLPAEAFQFGLSREQSSQVG